MVAALTVVLDGVVLVVRGGDDDGRPAVLGTSVERTSTTTSPATTTSTTPMGALDDTTTSAVPIVGQPPATTTTAPGGPRPTTTSAPAPVPRRVTERSDNTAAFTYGPGGATPIAVVQHDPTDAFRFIVHAQDADQDGTAELKTELANQTQRDVRFPGGMVLRFHVSRDGHFWRTVELTFPDLQTLPARGSLEIESAVQLPGTGRYDIVGETVVEYS